jgi:hypothetical protein
MFALRLMMQAANSFQKFIGACRTWVLSTFARDAFLKSQFAKLQQILVDQFNAVSTPNKPSNCIEIVGMMPAPSLVTCVDGGLDVDACVIFCVCNMQLPEVQELFSPANNAYFLNCGIQKANCFNAITAPVFYERLAAFRQAQWTQRLPAEVVALVADEYARRERYVYREPVYSTPIMTIWTQKGMTAHDWLNAGVNAPRDTALCFADTVEQFKRMSAAVVKYVRIKRTTVG